MKDKKTTQQTLTPAQTKALDQVAEIMKEHFGTYVICYDKEAETDERGHVTGHEYHGGHAKAAGLLYLTLGKIKADHLDCKQVPDAPL